MIIGVYLEKIYQCNLYSVYINFFYEVPKGGGRKHNINHSFCSMKQTKHLPRIYHKIS